MSVQLQTRSLPSSVAPIVEELELEQPAVVTKDLLERLAARRDVEVNVDVLVERLVRRGWLLPLRVRGAWEFAPAARAGRISSGDPWIELRAFLEREPEAPVAVGYESAIWELGHSTHQPSKPVLAHRKGWRPPPSLGARTVAFDWRLPVIQSRGLPVWTAETVIVAAAARPAAQRNWANADDWLPRLFSGIQPDRLVAEADGRTVSTLARLGYLAERASRDDLADRVEELLPAGLPVTFLGRRDNQARWSRRWRVYDGLLPRG